MRSGVCHVVLGTPTAAPPLVLLSFTDAQLEAVVGGVRVSVAPREIAVLGGDATG